MNVTPRPPNGFYFSSATLTHGWRTPATGEWYLFQSKPISLFDHSN